MRLGLRDECLSGFSNKSFGTDWHGLRTDQRNTEEFASGRDRRYVQQRNGADFSGCGRQLFPECSSDRGDGQCLPAVDAAEGFRSSTLVLRQRCGRPVHHSDACGLCVQVDCRCQDGGAGLTHRDWSCYWRNFPSVFVERGATLVQPGLAGNLLSLHLDWMDSESSVGENIGLKTQRTQVQR